MIQPTTAYIVTKGMYEDYRWLAVFTEKRGAQEYADHVNLTSERYREEDKAGVEEIDLYREGWRRPATADVIDGEVVVDTYPTRAIGGAS